MIIVCIHLIHKSIDSWEFLIKEQEWYSHNSLENSYFYRSCDFIPNFKNTMNEYYSNNSKIYTIYFYAGSIANPTDRNTYKNILDIDVNNSNSYEIIKSFFGSINFMEYVKLEPHYDIIQNSTSNNSITLRDVNNTYSLLDKILSVQKILWATKLPVPNFSDTLPKTTTSKFLFTRYGIVELKLIEKYIFSKPELKKYYNENIHKFISHQDNTIIPDQTSQHPLYTLMTNAGFYVTNKQHSFSILEDFCERYIRAISNSDYLQRCDGCFKLDNIISMEYSLGWKNKYFSIDFRKDIYKLIENKVILVVSPFVKKIQEQYSSGNMFKLYNDMEIPQFKIHTVYTPITVYGNPINESWKDTFEKTCINIKNEIEINKDIDIVIPSCGCYGIPICDYVYTELDTSAFYVGNLSHIIYGILQNTTDESVPPSVRDEGYWVKNDNIHNIKNLDKIDGGRYI